MRSEMTKLVDKLDSANIPYVVELDDFHSYHILYPDNWKNGCKCSVICHEHSYGGKEGFLEIMGLLTPEEEKYDGVVGWLTAKDVFERIYNDYMSSY